MTSSKAQNLLYILVAVFIVGFLMLVAPKTILSPQGIVLPAVAAFPSKVSVAKVKVFNDEKDIPSDAKLLASINVENHFEIASDEKRIEAENYARQLAADIGARGMTMVVLSNTPLNQPSNQLSTYIIRANAYSIL